MQKSFGFSETDLKQIYRGNGIVLCEMIHKKAVKQARIKK